MTLYECAAHIGENGLVSGGKPGDQHGDEVSVELYDNYPYDGILRYTGKAAESVRNRLMTCAYVTARDDKVGYSQSTRIGFYDYMEAQGWKLCKVKNCVKVNTDCSQFMAVCANVALVRLGLASPIPDDCYTGNMREYFEPRGFKWITKGINLGSGRGLSPGDILLNELNHTSMFFGTSKKGKRYNAPTAEPQVLALLGVKVVTGSDLTAVANAVIDGKYGNGDDRIKRLKAAGYDPVKVQKRVNELMGA